MDNGNFIVFVIWACGRSLFFSLIFGRTVSREQWKLVYLRYWGYSELWIMEACTSSLFSVRWVANNRSFYIFVTQCTVTREQWKLVHLCYWSYGDSWTMEACTSLLFGRKSLMWVVNNGNGVTFVIWAVMWGIRRKLRECWTMKTFTFSLFARTVCREQWTLVHLRYLGIRYITNNGKWIQSDKQRPSGRRGRLKCLTLSANRRVSYAQ